MRIRPSDFLRVAVAAILLLPLACGDETHPVSRTRLEVVRTVPWKDATAVPTGIAIQLEFQRDVEPGELPAGAFLLGDQPLPISSVHGRTVTLQPPHPLQFNFLYLVKVNRAAWRGASSAPATDYAWSFTTDPGPPGATWGTVDTGTSADLNSISENDGFYVAGDASTLLYSWLATSWSPRVYSVPPGDLSRVYRRGGVDVLLDASGRLFVSRDGVSWQAWDPGVANFTALAMDVGNTWVIAGVRADQSGTGVLVNFDGQNVTTTELPGHALHDVFFVSSPSQFVAVGAEGAIFASADGRAWTEAAVPSGAGDLDAVAARAGSGVRYVAVGSRILTSDDGLSWNLSEFVPASALEDVIWSGQAFVAVGAGGLVVSSEDGSDWVVQHGGGEVALHGVASGSGGSRWVAVGDRGVVLVTPSPLPVNVLNDR